MRAAAKTRLRDEFFSYFALICVRWAVGWIGRACEFDTYPYPAIQLLRDLSAAVRQHGRLYDRQQKRDPS